jgi:hypothetical protein
MDQLLDSIISPVIGGFDLARRLDSLLRPMLKKRVTSRPQMRWWIKTNLGQALSLIGQPVGVLPLHSHKPCPFIFHKSSGVRSGGRHLRRGQTRSG